MSHVGFVPLLNAETLKPTLGTQPALLSQVPKYQDFKLFLLPGIQMEEASTLDIRL